jgi:hypothetical protein
MKPDQLRPGQVATRAGRSWSTAIQRRSLVAVGANRGPLPRVVLDRTRVGAPRRKRMPDAASASAGNPAESG